MKAPESGFGERLRAAIERSGKSINSVARETHTDRSQLTRMLNGRTLPGADKLIALAIATGSTVDELLGRAEDGLRALPQPPPIPARILALATDLTRLSAQDRRLVMQFVARLLGESTSAGSSEAPGDTPGTPSATTGAPGRRRAAGGRR